MGIAKNRLLLLFVIGGTLLATSWATAAGSPQRVLLREGKIGRSVWAAWLEPTKKSGRAGERVCRSLALAGPSAGGLVAQSEYRECGAVSESSPIIESIDRGQGLKRRTVWLGLFSADVSSVYIKIGHVRGGNVQLSRLSEENAEALGTSRLTFWVHGFSRGACLARLITYDSSGEMLSDSGRNPCH
jgi:hypothetical protein